MKKQAIILSLIVVAAMMSHQAFAATMTIIPASINAAKGQYFNVTIKINPQGTAVYTAKIALQFPADLLAVDSFTFGQNWMALNQTGYDVINNGSGVIVKTAGYPGGVSVPVDLGTIRFYAKEGGRSEMKINADSLIYDANSDNVLTGAPVSATLVISAPSAAPRPRIEIKEGSVATSTASTTLPRISEEAERIAIPADEAERVGFLAAIGSVISLGTKKVWVGLLVAAIVILLAIYAVSVIKKRRQ